MPQALNSKARGQRRSRATLGTPERMPQKIPGVWGWPPHPNNTARKARPTTLIPTRCCLKRVDTFRFEGHSPCFRTERRNPYSETGATSPRQPQKPLGCGRSPRWDFSWQSLRTHQPPSQSGERLFVTRGQPLPKTIFLSPSFLFFIRAPLSFRLFRVFRGHQSPPPDRVLLQPLPKQHPPAPQRSQFSKTVQTCIFSIEKSCQLARLLLCT